MVGIANREQRGASDLMLVIVVVIVMSLGGFLFLRLNESREEAEREAGLLRTNPIVVHISVDGLRTDHINLVEMITTNILKEGGSSTLNARTDPDFTNTLPNHSSQLTGRPVNGDVGHGVFFNGLEDTTLHETSPDDYVASVFDVVHDNGGSTMLITEKDKFQIYENSWSKNGAADETGENNGTDKIDEYLFMPDDGVRELTRFLANAEGPTYALFHIKAPDTEGHISTWGSNEYDEAVIEADKIINRIKSALEFNELMLRTTIIISADHGGPLEELTHNDATNPENFTVPLIINGPAATVGGDLYDLNSDDRREPGSEQFSAQGLQPIRTAEIANLALDILGLPPVPGSYFNTAQDLDF